MQVSKGVFAAIVAVVVVIIVIIGIKTMGIGRGKAIDQSGMRERYERMTSGRHEAPPPDESGNAAMPMPPGR